MKVIRIILDYLLRLLSWLPLGFHYACCGILAFVMKNVMRYRRDVVVTNISRSFPEMKYKEIRKTVSKFYSHLGEVIAEAILPYGSKDIIVAYKPLSSKVWDYVMRRNRCAAVLRENYQGYIPNQEILRYALAHRSENKIYIFPNDQYPYSAAKSYSTLEFLNQETKVMKCGAALAHKVGMSVVYMNMRALSRGRYNQEYTLICEDASLMEPDEIMKRYFSLLEKDIQQTPWNYLWSHKRWK